MGPMRSIVAAACTAVLLTAGSTAAQTTQDRLTFVTFSGPVSIPGKTLPAGTYTFKLADTTADRHVVQVFDKDQTKILATLLAVAADRVEASGNPVITFKETATDRPPAVHYWYYAGERSGNEFVYPKAQALMIARASGEGVMAVDTDSTDIADWQKGTPKRVTADAEPQPAASATTTSSSSTGSTASDTTMAGQSTTPPPTQPTTAPTTTPTTAPTSSAPTTAPTTEPTTAPTPAPAQPTTAAPTDTDRAVGTSGHTASKELPHTASEVPAVGLIGVLALAGALVLRVARRATV